MNSDPLKLHKIYRETLSRVDLCTGRVAENRDVMSSLEFARYVFWSGILELLEANPQEPPLKVDGAFLRWKVKELQEACLERFKTNSVEPRLTELQLQSLHENINLMAGYLAKLVVHPGTVASPGPDLRVLEGGLLNEARNEGS